MLLRGWLRLAACLSMVWGAAADSQVVGPPQMPPWLLALGFALALISCFQYCHWKERARMFLDSPILAKALDDEYLANCTRGRQGYQAGEMTDEKKAVVREAFLEQLRHDPECPLSYPYWSNTLLPSLFYRWPIMVFKRLIGRVDEGDAETQKEMAEEAEEQRQVEEEERKEREEKARWAAEKEERKAKNAAHLAEKQRLEEEKHRKWAEEAEQESSGEEARDEGDLIVTGKVASVDELRKKGHYLIEVTYGQEERVQLVITSPAKIGQQATVALEGATLENGSQAKRSKLAGEWSEGVLLKLGSAPGKPAEPAPVVEEADVAEEKQAADIPGGGDGKARQRKKKNKG